MLKIIDILQLIADRKEVPKNIKYRDSYWQYDDKDQDYFNVRCPDTDDLFTRLFRDMRTLDFINDLVEKVKE